MRIADDRTEHRNGGPAASRSRLVHGDTTSRDGAPGPEEEALGPASELAAGVEESPGSREGPGADRVERVSRLLDEGEVVLVLPTEIFVHFYPDSPEQVINAFYRAGFRETHFELLGDELVAYEYLRIWRENDEKETWIRSTHPLVVEYCRARHPELVPLLAPVVTPAVALARFLRLELPEDIPLVYAGLDQPTEEGSGPFTAFLTFSDLEELLESRGAPPSDQPHLLRVLPPERHRFLSTAGGLPLPMLDSERASSRTFRKLRGLHTLSGLARLIEKGGKRLGFIDILPFDGTLDHPMLGPREELFWRRNIMELAEPPRADSPVVTPPPELDLSIRYEPEMQEGLQDEVEEVRRILEEVKANSNGTYWRHDPGGFASYLSLAEALMRDSPDLAVGLFHMSRNYRQALRDATHDALTGLYSYRALVQRVEEELGQANRAGASLALLFIDLDVFKEINDEYGHPTGNEALRRVADVLTNSIRSTDIAGRFGGDEFVVLLVNADPEGALRVAEEIRKAIAEIEIPVLGGVAGTTCSVGIAYHAGAERSPTSADELFAEADASLYIAKAHGGNRVHPAAREELSG